MKCKSVEQAAMDDLSSVPTLQLDLVPPSPLREPAPCVTSRREQLGATASNGIASCSTYGCSAFVAAQLESAAGANFEQASTQASRQAACAQVELQAACAQVERSLVEHYVGLLEDERNKRMPIEEELHKTRLLLERTRARRKAREQYIQQDQSQLRQRINDLDQLQASEHDALTSQIDLERSSAQVDQDRLRQLLQQSEMCQRKLVQDVSALVLERETMKKSANLLGNQSSKKRPSESTSTLRRNRTISLSPTRCSASAVPYAIAMRSGMKLSNVALKCAQGHQSATPAPVEDGSADGFASTTVAKPDVSKVQDSSRCSELRDGGRTRIDMILADRVPTPCRNTRQFAQSALTCRGILAEHPKQDCQASASCVPALKLGKLVASVPPPIVSPRVSSPRCSTAASGQSSEVADNEAFDVYVRHMQVAAKRMTSIQPS